MYTIQINANDTIVEAAQVTHLAGRDRNNHVGIKDTKVETEVD